MRAQVAVAVVALVAGSFLPSHASARAAETCRGQAATHVGTSGEELVGTDGVDVIVTNSASRVYALDGNDLICVTGRTFDTFAGFGDDVVDGSAAAKATGASADLGGGSDTYVGSVGYDKVNAGDGYDVRRGLVPGTDVVDTGGGEDFVILGADGLASDDQVRLADGGDAVEIRGQVPTTLDGGPGRDVIRMRSRTPSDWRFDGRTGVFTVDGAPMPPAVSFSTYDFTGLRWASLAVRGGEGSERVLAQKRGYVVKDGPFRARMGGGNDQVEVRTGHTGPFNGGPGNDSVLLANESNQDLGGRFTAHLVDDYYRLQGGAKVAIKSIENFSGFSFDAALIVGDSADNRLRATGCGLVIRGGAGDDFLSGFQSKGCYDSGGRAVTAYGEGGNDVMDGSNIADVLLGGPGFDVARGRDGRDRCVAERRFDCELG
jgi:Ca2+-binding RTX toxin-like protein